MRDLPDGQALLALAHAIERDPSTEQDTWELSSKIERCRAIALRERQGEAAWIALRAELQGLAPGETAEVSLRRLAGAIRAGRYDEPSPSADAVRRLLWAVTRQKLRESNPEFLERVPAPHSHSA